MNDPAVFATSRLVEADMAVNLLEERGVPFYRSMEAGGVRRAMQAAPADFPGVLWVVHVPEENRQEAERLLATIRHGSVPPSRRNRVGLLLLLAATLVILLPMLSWARCV
jgi:hypothetical protein